MMACFTNRGGSYLLGRALFLGPFWPTWFVLNHVSILTLRSLKAKQRTQRERIEALHAKKLDTVQGILDRIYALLEQIRC